MKTFVIIGGFLLMAGNSFCQQWTAAQLQNANTAADEYRLTAAEKEVILYLNLCRLYPGEFVKNELEHYKGVPGIEDPNFAAYKASLIKELLDRQAVPPLKPDELLYDDAKCYGNEISKNKRKPHERIDCLKRNYAECVYYGKGDGKHIALQWLIDSGVENLGHRKICLLAAHRKVGIKINPHFEYAACAVIELSK